MTLSIVGFDDLVTSFVATIANGWSDPCRVGLSPTGKPRLYTAHAAIGGYRCRGHGVPVTGKFDPGPVIDPAVLSLQCHELAPRHCRFPWLECGTDPCAR
jgi:hypothetical protein